MEMSPAPRIRERWTMRLLFLLLLLWFVFSALLIAWMYRDGASCRPFTDLLQHYVAGRMLPADGWIALYHDGTLGSRIREFLTPYPETTVNREDIFFTSTQPFNYIYCPLVARCAAGFSSIPYRCWSSFWLPFTLLCHVLACVLLRRATRSAFLSTPPGMLYFLTFFSFLNSLLYEQNSPLSLLIVCASGWALSRGRPLLAGAIFSCLFYKPQFFPCVVLMMWFAGRRPFVAATLACGAGWFLLGCLLCGWEAHMAWLQSLMNMLNGIQFTWPGINQSWQSLLLALGFGGLPGGTWAAAALSLAGPAFAGWWWKHHTPPATNPALGLFFAMALGLVLSPYVANYDLLLALPWICASLRGGAPNPALLVLPWAGAFLAYLGIFTGVPLALPCVTLWLLLSLRHLRGPSRPIPSPAK